MDIRKLRGDFPLLAESNGRKPVIYFDNACQSLRPGSVIDAICAYYEELSACGGRSMHHLAAEVTQRCDQARGEVARFLNASKKEEIIFQRNTTEGINLVAHSLGLKAGDSVLISDKEHNSNLIPWQKLAKQNGIQVKIIPSTPENTFDLSAYEKLLDPTVKLVSVGYTSNLDGVTLPAEEIIRTAHQSGALVMLDAAQTAPHKKINVKSLDVDFLAFSGHKMLGPSGTGVLYGKYPLLEKLEPFLVGGDTVASSTYEDCEFLAPPEKFEAGLQDYAGIMGLGVAVKYLQAVGMDAIQKQEQLLNELITSQLLGLPRLTLIGPADPQQRGSIFSFYLDGVDSHRVALMLDQMSGILVRSGQHCVHSWFHAHQIKGSVRVSFYFYNTIEETNQFCDQLKKVLRIL